MNTRKTRYWGFRIDKRNPDFFWNELHNGNLRIGWGFDKRQNLRKQKQYAEFWKGGADGAKPNLKILERVKKGDMLLVPQIPDWDKVAVVEATEDFDKGYRFEIPGNEGDYGHIFPAKIERSFARSNKHVSGNIRSTLKAQCRFWNLDWCRDDVEEIRVAPQSELEKAQSNIDRLGNAINTAFNEFSKKFEQDVCERINRATNAEAWEYVLVDVLKTLFPQYNVERVGGKSEAHHGTDILMKIPAPFGGYEYGIAIQVKDYEGRVGEHVIDQINKAKDAWREGGVKIIENVVVLTKAKKEENGHLINSASGVKFMFSNELNPTLFQYAVKHIGMQDD